MRMAQDPKAEIVFPPQDHWPNGCQHVVKGHGNGRGDLAASEDPGEQDGKQCLEAEHRSKSPENPDRCPARDSPGTIPNLPELLKSALEKLF